MNKVAWGLVSVVALVVGCGSSGGSSDDPFGPDPDFGAVEARFDHPDGTLNAGNAGTLLARALSQSTSPVYGPGASSSSSSSSSPGGTTTQSLHPLGGSAFEGCQALASGQRSGSCACPAGGSLAWDFAGGSGSSTMRFRMDQCASGDETIDGREFMRVTSNQGDPNGASMLFVIHASVTRAGVLHAIDAEEQFGNGKLEITVKVDDGWVVLSLTTSSDGQSETFSVRDKNGTWSCVVQNGKGTCTGDNGQAPVTF